MLSYSNRCYTRVTDDQKQELINMLNVNPQMQVKEAARLTGIKYPRATAIYRTYKT